MADAAEPILWRRTTRQRVAAIAVFFAIWGVAIQAKLVYLQVFQHEELLAKAHAQHERELKVDGQRGEIVDRHGRTLATSVEAYSAVVEPAKMVKGEKPTKNDPGLKAHDPKEAADKICSVLGCTPKQHDDLVAKLKPETGKYVVYVQHRMTPDAARALAALKIPGLSFVRESKRWYPNRELAAHLLGYVGAQHTGLAGLELHFESQLKGVGTRLEVLKDGKQRIFSQNGAPPRPGATLELTIDSQIQHIAERELKAAVIEHLADGGCVVVMDPYTGEILAAASYPTFNPNSYNLFTEEERFNSAIQGSYEPGSTFKIVTASAALDEKVLTPDTVFHTGNGVIKIPGRSSPVRDTHVHGSISFFDAIVVSSNVAAIQAGQRLGAARLGPHVRAFGFGTRLSPDFAAKYESAGLVADTKTWKESTLASISMGYEIMVTPLQMAAAASAVANGGNLVQPRVLRAVIKGNQRVLQPTKVLRPVMSPSAASELKSMMEAVVERGTGKQAQVPGYSVAGKTGTAKKVVGGRYVSLYHSSFVGFVPSRERPALTILVVIDSPRSKKGYYGGAVAAPAFSRIASAALRHLGVPPNLNPLPPVISAKPAQQLLVSGPATPPTITPAPPRRFAGELVVPELRGASAREALRVLTGLGLTARLSGDGLVVEQDPPPGTPITPGASCRLALARTPREAVAGIQP